MPQMFPSFLSIMFIYFMVVYVFFFSNIYWMSPFYIKNKKENVISKKKSLFFNW